MKDEDIKITAEHPEANVKHIARGIVRRGLKVVRPKTAISLRVDSDVLEWFKAQGPLLKLKLQGKLDIARVESSPKDSSERSRR